MVDDWWQPAPAKIATPSTLRWESGGKKCSYLSGIYGILKGIFYITQIGRSSILQGTGTINKNSSLWCCTDRSTIFTVYHHVCFTEIEKAVDLYLKGRLTLSLRYAECLIRKLTELPIRNRAFSFFAY